MTGELAGGQTVRVTYVATVNAVDARGNNTANNFLVNTGSEPPAECVEGATDCTLTLLPALDVAKSVDPATGTAVEPGQTLTYSLDFANTNGTADAEVNYVDFLEGVLDDADLVEGSLNAGELTAELADGRINVTGTVPAGETRTVTYQVIVKDAADLGDQNLGNFLVPTDPENPGEQVPPTECVDGVLCTENPVPVDEPSPTPTEPTEEPTPTEPTEEPTPTEPTEEPTQDPKPSDPPRKNENLADTGAAGITAVLTGGLALLAVGFMLFIRTKRRQH